MAVRDASRIELAGGFVQQVLRLFDFVERDDERKHDSDVSMHRCPEQRTKLRLEQFWLVEAHPDRAPAEEWVGIGRVAADGQLVAANVECANHNRTSTKRFDDVPVGAVLLFLV